MKILVIGDIVGRPGRTAVRDRVQDLREQYKADLIVANVENLAGGYSVTPPLVEELLAAGVDVMTSGNHIFDKREAIDYIAQQPRLLRPANYPPGTPGRGLWTGEIGDTPVAVINLIGRVFMGPADDPFRAADAILRELDQDIKVRLVDFHAEATSEKCALGWYLDGRVSAVFGTHTHVQTADERILPRGTAYITDIGMTGSHAGVIGMDRDDVIARFLTVTHRRMENAKGDVRICGIALDIDETTGRAREITRLALRHEP